MDLYRHTMDYYYFKNQDFNEFISANRLDFTLYICSFILGKCGIPFEFLRFIFVLTSYLISFYIYENITHLLNIVNNKERFRLFLCFLFIVPFIAVSLGLRFGFASSIMLLAIYEFYIKNNKIKSFILICFSIFSHFSMLAFALLIPISHRIKLNFRPMTILIFSTSLSVVAFSLFSMIVEIIPNEYLLNKISFYTGDGIYGGTNAITTNTWQNLFRFMSRFIKPIIIYFTILFICKNTTLRNYLVCTLFFICLLYPNISPMLRYSLFVSEIGLLCLAVSSFFFSSTKSWLFVFMLGIACFLEIYADRNAILAERFLTLTYIPLPFHFFYHDELNFMINNFDSEGYYIHF